MTIKIAKKIVKGITDKIECNTADIDDWAEFWGFTREEYEEFLDIPLKALEQEPRKDEVILTKEEYGELVSSEFDNGYAKGYTEALEQNDVLDKIRDEIEELKNAPPCFDDMFEYKYAVDECLEIIDKYKVESEG